MDENIGKLYSIITYSSSLCWLYHDGDSDKEPKSTEEVQPTAILGNRLIT